MKTEPALSRRSLLCAAPTLATPALFVGPAVASADTPLPAPTPDPLPGLLAERERLEKEWLAFPGAEEGTLAARAAWDAYQRAEDLIETTVATTPEGVAAQIDYMKASYGSPELEPVGPLFAEEVPFAFLDVMLAGLRRIGQ